MQTINLLFKRVRNCNLPHYEGLAGKTGIIVELQQTMDFSRVYWTLTLYYADLKQVLLQNNFDTIKECEAQIKKSFYPDTVILAYATVHGIGVIGLDEEADKKKTKCTCDMQIIMCKGCQCGGI